MGLLYIVLYFSFFVLFFFNIVWIGINAYLWAANGLHFLIQGMNIIETVYASIFLKWLILADIIWILGALSFVFTRKNYKIEEHYYYQNNPIQIPKVCVIIPTYNEEVGIESVIKDYQNQSNIEEIIVIDNHSEDRTVEIAKSLNVKVIAKEVNKGGAHSWVMGFKEALKTDANIVVLTDGDGTFIGKDLQKMIPYLDHCDMVLGTRQIQILSQKGNQNSMFYVWGNLYVAKLLQIKYFNLQHTGVLELTDIGCAYRAIRRESLEKIIDKFTYPGTDVLVKDANGSTMAIFMIMLAVENSLRVLEIPVSFLIRKGGLSKSEAGNKSRGFRYGLKFIWLILKR